ncbi:MAG: ketoacyl-ACP synthase III, partial [Chloroflexota bacterium]|nr:ketoacyl-ACP synthase III [Chloroflexota bacterium]
TCVLFGDGAGAVIVSASDEPGGLLGLDMYSDGSGAQGIIFPAGGSACPTTPRTVAEGGHFVHMAGKEVYRYATRQLAESAQAALRHASLTVDDVDQFLFHQANLRIIENVQNAVGIPAEKTYLNIVRYGNTSAASVPMALVEALAEDRIRPGDRLLMAAFGAGYTAGAAVVEWTADPARRSLAPGAQTRIGPVQPDPVRADVAAAVTAL